MDRLSVILLYRFDDDQIEKSIRSAQDIADEIILVDPENRPKSKEIVNNFQSRYLPGNGTELIRLLEEAAELTTTKRIFHIGSNEYLTESLRRSIRKIKENWDHDGYTVSRFKNYYGKWMRHSGIYPDQPVRLYKKNKGYWTGEPLEEHIRLKDPESCSLLKGDLYCTVFKNIQEHIGYINQATQIEANKSFNRGRYVNTLEIIFSPLKFFLRQYFIKLGFLDGFYGLIFSVLMGFSKFLELIKLRDLIRTKKL